MAAIEPRMGPESYKTYSIHVPSSDWRAPTPDEVRSGKACETAGCDHFLHGWKVRVEGLPPDMVHAAKTSGRTFQEVHVAEGETWLHFAAGQPCFRATEHRTRIGRPELYLVRDGDHRGNPRGTRARQHLRPELWQEDFAEHQQGLADAFQRG